MKSRNTLHSPGGLGYLRGVEEDHDEFTERLRKTLYYGKLPGTDRPSKPLTDMAVEFFQEAAPKQLGKLDNYLAASTARSACMSPCSVVVGMMYVRRLRQRRPSYLTQISSSELFLISMMMASKFLYDEGVDEEVFNDEWAESGDLDTEDVNQLERDFLQAIDWHLFLRPEEFAEMLRTMEKRIALQQGIERGWFSYTDLYILSEDLKLMDWSLLTSEFSKVVSVSSLAYIAGILTMVGSTILSSTTSASLVTFGTTVLPLFVRTPPALMPTITSLEQERYLPMAVVDQSGHVAMNMSRTEEENGWDDGVETKRVIEQIAHGGQSDLRPNEQITSEDERSNGLKSEENGVGRSELEAKEHTSVLNSFFPSFLALVTLKDTILKFAYAINSDSTNSHIQLPTGDDSNTDEICSEGPCLPDSWTNCWNVSSGFDWSAFKAEQARACCEELNPYVDSRSNDKVLSKSCLRFHGDGRCREPWSDGSNVHCCCKASPPQGYVSLSGYFPDLFLGFSTGSAVPIFVTA